MNVIWTLKNSPKPHIQAKATEFPHKSALIQRKFIGDPKNLQSGITASQSPNKHSNPLDKILPDAAFSPHSRNPPDPSRENYH
jgi:hypothetical protein